MSSKARMRRYWAVVDDHGAIYGMTVYATYSEAQRAQQWCVNNLDGGYRITALAAHPIGD
ncbi:MAG: hypothetical protein WBF97_11415 [Comamonas sp.]